MTRMGRAAAQLLIGLELVACAAEEERPTSTELATFEIPMQPVAAAQLSVVPRVVAEPSVQLRGDATIAFAIGDVYPTEVAATLSAPWAACEPLAGRMRLVGVEGGSAAIAAEFAGGGVRFRVAQEGMAKEWRSSGSRANTSRAPRSRAANRLRRSRSSPSSCR